MISSLTHKLNPLHESVVAYEDRDVVTFIGTQFTLWSAAVHEHSPQLLLVSRRCCLRHCKSVRLCYQTSQAWLPIAGGWNSKHLSRSICLALERMPQESVVRHYVYYFRDLGHQCARGRKCIICPKYFIFEQKIICAALLMILASLAVKSTVFPEAFVYAAPILRLSTSFKTNAMRPSVSSTWLGWNFVQLSSSSP